jgi:hypothetical protein
MGLDRRRKSGKILGGSNLIVQGDPIYSVKVFQNTFQYKKGTPKDTFREAPQEPPKPSPTPTPIVQTNYITTQNGNPIVTEDGFNILLY